mmetsp:Transcript_2022/g.5028  ORF Transcript_2022/g.5028 Transcript_2022/m.5028 type:complete len:418 (+) Transcript_2022:301-1554(+)
MALTPPPLSAALPSPAGVPSFGSEKCCARAAIHCCCAGLRGSMEVERVGPRMVVSGRRCASSPASTPVTASEPLNLVTAAHSSLDMSSESRTTRVYSLPLRPRLVQTTPMRSMDASVACNLASVCFSDSASASQRCWRSWNSASSSSSRCFLSSFCFMSADFRLRSSCATIDAFSRSCACISASSAFRVEGLAEGISETRPLLPRLKGEVGRELRTSTSSPSSSSLSMTTGSVCAVAARCLLRRASSSAYMSCSAASASARRRISSSSCVCTAPLVSFAARAWSRAAAVDADAATTAALASASWRSSRTFSRRTSSWAAIVFFRADSLADSFRMASRLSASAACRPAASSCSRRRSSWTCAPALRAARLLSSALRASACSECLSCASSTWLRIATSLSNWLDSDLASSLGSMSTVLS